MNIGQLASAADVSTGTLRHYERQGLLPRAKRQGNGYRAYTEADLELVRFVRGAQALGFSLTEIGRILPQVTSGQFGRAEIEQQLQAKIGQIDAHMRQLRTLKKELLAAFSSLKCPPSAPVSAGDATAVDTGSGAGAEIVRKSFSRVR